MMAQSCERNGDSDEGAFWDRRFREEGAVWGEAPSPTALLAATYARPGDRVLDVGFGYGRDLPFLARQGYQISGIDLSVEGRKLAEARLRREGLAPECLVTGRFEDGPFPDHAF